MNHLWLLVSITIACGLILFSIAAHFGFGGEPTLRTAEAWEVLIRQVGAPEARALLLTEGATLTATQNHALAHNFGEGLYRAAGAAGLSICTDDFNYGCYHQFIGAAVQAHGIGIANQLDTACGENGGCRHGVGHGLVGYFGYRFSALEQALAVCDSLPKKGTWVPCLDGSFMEYNQRQLTALEGPPTPRPLTEGLYSPCLEVAAQHKAHCVFRLPQWWSSVLEASSPPDTRYAIFGGYCGALGTQLSESCFLGIGFVATFMSDLNQAEAHRLCGLAARSETEVAHCNRGIAMRLTLGR